MFTAFDALCQMTLVPIIHAEAYGEITVRKSDENAPKYSKEISGVRKGMKEQYAMKKRWWKW